MPSFYQINSLYFLLALLYSTERCLALRKSKQKNEFKYFSFSLSMRQKSWLTFSEFPIILHWYLSAMATSDSIFTVVNSSILLSLHQKYGVLVASVSFVRSPDGSYSFRGQGNISHIWVVLRKSNAQARSKLTKGTHLSLR